MTRWFALPDHSCTNTVAACGVGRRHWSGAKRWNGCAIGEQPRTACQRHGLASDSWSETFDGVRVAMWHARTGSDMDAIDEDKLEPGEADAVLVEAQADVLVVGHYHEPGVLRLRDGVIVRPGALGVETVEAPWLLDKESGRFVQEERRAGTFAVIELPSLSVEIVEVLPSL